MSKRTDQDRLAESARFVEEIGDALRRAPALTKNQLDDVTRLRSEIEEYCRTGDMDRARQCRELAMKVVRSGAPASE